MEPKANRGHTWMTERPRLLTMKQTNLHFNREQNLPGKAWNAKNIHAIEEPMVNRELILLSHCSLASWHDAPYPISG
jgi:hypothetical protein